MLIIILFNEYVKKQFEIRNIAAKCYTKTGIHSVTKRLMLCYLNDLWAYVILTQFICSVESVL